MLVQTLNRWLGQKNGSDRGRTLRHSGVGVQAIGGDIACESYANGNNQCISLSEASLVDTSR